MDDGGWLDVQVVGGPMVNVHLCATVTVPDLHISSDVVEFGEVKCGQCQIVTVQLHNYQAVPCDWSAIPRQPTKKQVWKPHIFCFYVLYDRSFCSNGPRI